MHLKITSCSKLFKAILLVSTLLFISPNARAQKGPANSFASPEAAIEQINELEYMGKHQAMLQTALDALGQFPEHLEILGINADLCFQFGDLDTAFSLYSRSIELDSTNRFSWQARAYFLLEAGAYRAAIVDYEHAVSLAPSDSIKYELYLNLASAYMSIRAFQQAHQLLEEGLSYNPDDVDFLNNMAVVSDEIGQPEKVLPLLQRIVELDSLNIGAWINLGFYHQTREEFAASLPYFDRAQQLAPEEPLIYSNRATSLLGLGNLRKAMEDVNHSLALLPTNSWAYKVKARILLEMGESREACLNLTRSLELGYTEQYGDEVLDLQRLHCLLERH
ncbi:MAG: tetratricopeptide repeat protein [Bacteroidota bacterium]